MFSEENRLPPCTLICEKSLAMFICDVWCLIYMVLALLLFILKWYIIAILIELSKHFIGIDFTLYMMLGILAVYYWQTCLDVESG